MKKIRTLLLLAALSFAASAAQAAPISSGLGQSFACDVNTGYCTCSGSWEGADCKGMAPNCKLEEPPGTIWKSCEIGKGCKCRMFRMAPKGAQSKGPRPTVRAPR